MRACDQTVAQYNMAQFMLYRNLIDEECKELAQACDTDDAVETLDALIDILVVTIGAIHSMGADGEGAWKEVMTTNFAKIGEDGKVLKPQGWEPPNLKPFLQRKGAFNKFS